jgi:hypothetical protein
VHTLDDLQEMVATLLPDVVRYCATPEERAMLEHVMSSALDRTLH